MPYTHAITSKEVVGCRAQAHLLRMPTELEQAGLKECLRMLRDQSYPKLSLERDSDKAILMQALRTGKLKHTERVGGFVGKNVVVDGFFTSLFSAFSGAASNGLEMKYAAIGTNGSAVGGTDTQLNNEVFRFDLAGSNAERFAAGKKYYNSVFLTSTQGDLSAGNTAVASGSWTTTVFDVASAASILVGDKIEVQTALGFRNVQVTAKSSNTLTVSPALPVAPTNGQTVKRLWAEYGLFMGPSATGTANSGVLVNHEIDDLLKGEFTCIFDLVLTWAVV